MVRALVPYEYAPGKFVSVPDDTPGLRLPDVPRPSMPDARVAAIGDSAWGAGAPPDPSTFAETPQDRTVRETREALAPKGDNAHAPQPTRTDDLAKLGGKEDKGGVDPSTLAKPAEAGAPSAEKPGDDDLVHQYIQQQLKGGSGGGRRGPLTPSSMKEERTPGRELLPEYRWRLGLEGRPDLGTEDDPEDARLATWGGPRQRPVTTPLEKSMAASRASAERIGRQQIEAERAAHNDRLAQLDEETHLIDEELAIKAERRQRIADLQKAADERADEAASVKPRTHEQVWRGKSTVARIGAVISMALGGYLQGSGRTRSNPGWDMISKMIDDDVQDDVAAYERAETRATKAQGAYDRALSVYGDPELAMLDVRRRKLANAHAMIQAQSQIKGLDASTQDRLAQLGAAAEQATLDATQAMYDTIADKVTKQEIAYTSAPAGGGGGRDVASVYAKAAQLKKNKAIVDGTEAPDVKPSDLKDVNQSDASLAAVDKMLKQYGEADIPGLGEPNVVSRGVRSVADWAAGSGSGSKLLDSPEERRNKQATANLVAGVIQSISGAGVSNEERANLNEMIRGARTKADLVNIVNVIRTKNAEFRRLAAGGKQTPPTSTARSERAIE